MSEAKPISESAGPERFAKILHDLRTPLSQIIGLSEMLLEIAEEEGHRDLFAGLNTMREAGQELAGLLQNQQSLSLGLPLEGESSPLSDAVRAGVSRVLGYADLVLGEESGTHLDGYRHDLNSIRTAGRSFVKMARESGLHLLLETERPWDAPAPAARPNLKLSPALLEAHILVVDDENLNREVVCRRLQREGCQATEASSGLEALRLLRTETFDAMLLDMQMPEMSGLEVLQTVREDPALRSIPVIMLSAHTEVERVARCLELGAEDYLPKPVNSVLLRARLGACLEKKKMAEELLKAERLQSIGVLAGGLAHDFNNTLTMVQGNLSLIRYGQELSPASTIALQEAERGAIRAQDLTLYLLTFAEGGAPVKQLLHPQTLLQEEVSTLLRAEERRADLHLPHDLWPLEADPKQLKQVVENLVLNAIEATDPGDTIHLAATNVTGPLPAMGLQGEKYLRFTVRDPGVGIAPTHLPRVFDPFFTTKEQARGLGLATAYSIVQRHWGHIEIESKPGAGTTVTLYLPTGNCAVPIAPKPPSPEPLASTDRPRLRVLVMDDEEAIRSLSETMLVLLGYSVVSAACGEEALAAHEQAQREGRSFDIVVMDLTIPGGMGGAEAITRLRQKDTNIRAVVASGYSSDPVMANHTQYGFDSVLPKPYVINDLIRVLEELSASKCAAK